MLQILERACKPTQMAPNDLGNDYKITQFARKGVQEKILTKTLTLVSRLGHSLLSMNP